MVTIFSDGGSRGNPGHASCAFGIYENDKLIYSDAKYLGITTNNVAEYSGVVEALSWITQNLKEEKEITFKMDSELVVKQLKGLYKIRNSDLMKLSLDVKELISKNNLKVDFVHVPRAENAFADNLVNEKLDDSSRH